MRKILKIIDSNKITLAYLNNLESGTVKQVVNGEYILSFVALIEPLKTEFLYNKDNFIEYNNDWFKVINIEEEHNSDNMLKVYINCEHISYDLIKQTKLTYQQTDRSAIYVMNDLLLGSGFQFLGTDVTTTNSIEQKQETDIKSLLFMVTQIWGGELSYFQNTIELKQQLGTNRGVDFRWGKNLNNLRRYKDFVENTVAYEVEVIQGVLPKEFEGLEKFFLGDTIKVFDSALNIEINTRIIELETDIITGLNSRIILGQPIKDLSTGFSGIFDAINKTNTKIDSKTIELNNAIEEVANDIESVADGQIVTYYQDAQPTGKLGDLWFNTTTKKLYRYSTKWDLVEDKDITTAIEKAQNAQDTADKKIVSFYKDTIPTNAESSTGDLWIDTNDGNKLYRYNGTSWVSARDGSLAKIDNVVDENGKLIAEKLSGNLNTAITKVSNSTGKTTFDDRGLIVHNQPAETESTKAMLMTADGLLIANAKNADGTWRWRTAVTADGISADEITTGTLSAIDIFGVNINGSTIKSDNANAEIKLDAGVLSLKDKASTAQFNINYRDGLPQGILQSQLELYNEFKASNPNKPANNTMSLNSANSHMGIELGNGAVGLGNDWVKFSMYGGTFDWLEAYPEYADWESRGYLPPPITAQGAKLVIDLASSIWTFRPGYGLASSSIDINLSNECWINLKASLDVRGDFEVHGTKDCVIETEEYGKLHFGAYETPEYYFGDIGENEVVDGICAIELDERLTRCVNTDIPYQVFLTPYGDGNIYVTERNKESFVVKGNNIKFAWEVKAKRKNYENIRFGQTI